MNRIPTIAVALLSVIACTDGSEPADGQGPVGQGAGAAEPECIRIDRTEGLTIVPPAGVRVPFRVLDCDGLPVRRLTNEDVAIINDEKDEPFGAGLEGGGVSGVGTPSNFGLFTVLALDMSDSIFNAGALDDVIDGAQGFVNALVRDAPTGLRHQVALIAFGRPDTVEVVQPLTDDPEVLTGTLEGLRGSQSRGSTHLYGAYMMAADLVESGLAGSAGDLVEGFVVILTDGTHEAGDEDNLRQQALAARGASRATIYSIGIQGNYDESKLTELASRPTNFVRVENADALDEAFGEVGRRVEAIAQSNYVVGVCTPVSLGTPSLTIRVNVAGQSVETTLSYAVGSLNGDVAGCDAGAVAGLFDETCDPFEGAAQQDSTCDGLDDDCDGEVDEDFERKAEVCDGLDNDCDGAVDDLAECDPCHGADPPQGWVCVSPTGPGGFALGSPDDEPGHRDNEEQHRAVITRPFLISATELTQAEWEAVMGENPSQFSGCGADCPVETVSWFDAVEFCNGLSRSEGLEECYVIEGPTVTWPRGLACAGYRLPTDAEWEYAARAGTRTAYHAGPAEADLANVGWYGGNSGNATHPVAQKDPNGWGLYDVHGNVWEWTWDWYSDDYGGHEGMGGIVEDPTGPPAGVVRVLRGGSWLNYARDCRAAARDGLVPGIRFDDLGFRPARSVNP